MRPSRIAACLCSLLTAVCTLTATPTAHAAPRGYATGYVALGDSYSAGVGAGSYLTSSTNCLRSSRSFPALWAAANRPAGFDFAACNGARALDVLSGQLGPLNSRTGLVSITVGGSDAGFSHVMTTCVLHSSTTCLDAVKEALDRVDGALPGDLDRLYAAIRAKAPRAHVVVLGYPHLYQLNGGCKAGLSDTTRSALNGAVDRLDKVIEERATDHGFTYVDVTGAFTGHEICSVAPWLHSVNWLAPTESYHPTEQGQSQAYLPALTRTA
ncbi:SGNH/GDSL hydrolase family protein [Streptomyces sp. NPDC001848]|uniref:SGNH/GDSL hydrolase family protein n=1 Tax=Streptomyces sp. NPDC001848 TaxID=3364618 RepID=UPI003697B6AB